MIPCVFLLFLAENYKKYLFRVELVVQFPTRGLTQVLLCLFSGVLWLWHFLYSVGPHPVSSLHIYIFVVSRAFMAGAASQAGDADSSRTPGLTSALQGSVNVHRGAVLLVPQWQCISSFVFNLFMWKRRTHSYLILVLIKILKSKLVSKLVSTAAEWIVLPFDTLYYTELPPYSLKTEIENWVICTRDSFFN